MEKSHIKKNDLQLLKQNISIPGEICKKLEETDEEKWYYFILEVLEKIKNNNEKLCLVESCRITDFGWERLHIGNWKDVELHWRTIYSCGCLFKSFCLLSFDYFTEAAKCIDLALLMGDPEFQGIFHQFIELIQQFTNNINTTQLPTAKKQKLNVECSSELVWDISEKNSIPRVHNLNLQEFKEKYFDLKKPVIITGTMDHWPAVSKDSEKNWTNLEYLKQVAGIRTVPIEIGKNYASDNWSQKLMPLSNFINQFFEENNDEIGYLAQTPIFDQIPQLRKDIETPMYCCFTRQDEDTDFNETVINAWFGPKGTISPCHFDPYDNIFCQVVGVKYVRLYHPKYQENLYLHDDKLLFNTSQVDFEKIDEKKYPLFSEGVFEDCFLKSGELLYIPIEYFHYVKSLSTSFSVSFWFK